MFYFSKEDEHFPDILVRDESDIVAIGGSLSVERLLEAYSRGIFPWYAYKLEKVKWYCPETRFVIFPDEIHVSHSMRTLINSRNFSVTFNQNFHEVIDCCGKVDGRDMHPFAWLGNDIKVAYQKLANLGFASSVEVWDNSNGRLVGGLYGVTLNKCFMGESMFSFSPNASKFALIFLARKLASEGWKMIDCQMETPHLRSMGGRTISYGEYMSIISEKS